MGGLDNVRLTRRDMLRLGAGSAGLFALSASGLAVPRGLASGGGNIYLEAFPTSPLILRPFNDPLPIPSALAPIAKADVDTWKSPPGVDNQDYVKGGEAWKHQLWPGNGCVSDYSRTPTVYRMRLQVAGHDFTTSQVQPINSLGQDVAPPGSSDSRPRSLPQSTIYGFNGAFPGPRINAEYTKPILVRLENHLDEDNGFDRQDFGAPNHAFITHLHNGHTAPECDGNPHYGYRRFSPYGRLDHEAAYEPGEWVDNLYLGYPAGGDDREKQSFFWFHDHTHGHTGANVYKGMVGLMPIYDPKLDRGDETDPNGLRLPGVRTDNPDGSFDVEYDIPLALYDCRLDDGVTPHKDFHNGSGETHPEWWGKTYFRHLPNHGFVGDVFTVNGTAYPTLEVKRRKYRLRFLDASISRIYELKLMHAGAGVGPQPARSLGYTGDELQGQYRLPGGEQCMKFVEIANEGGLLPRPIVRDSFELWPAKRREFVVDFTRYQDGTPTKKGDEIYLVDVMKMTTGRMWDAADPNYKVPVMKIVIGDDAPDASRIPAAMRPVPDLVPGWQNAIKGAPTFELQRGSAAGAPETEWVINGQQFDATKPLISVKKDSGGVWKIRNGGGGWVHPMHLHMEEHRVITRNGRAAPDARHPDDTGKEDVVALDPSEEVVISRRFRTFVGPYVAHCHNLAHEDHNMMFGWEILP